jgi:hypothetical protein
MCRNVAVHRQSRGDGWVRRGWLRPAARVLATSLALAGGAPAAAGEGAVRPAGDDPARSRLVEAEAPPLSDGAFPCTSCHASQRPDPTRRELGYHDEQQSIFDHDTTHRWCLDCHDLEDRDRLRLASGERIAFTESYRLCGQCHGDKVRSWRAGVHGKRVGRWDGDKLYFLCVNCHNPHAPRFKGVVDVAVAGKRTVAPTQALLKPEPRPLRPEEQRP